MADVSPPPPGQAGGPPPGPPTGPPPGFYMWFVIDPQWQITFTIMWCSALGAFSLMALPAVIRAFKRCGLFSHVLGIRETSNEVSYSCISGEDTQAAVAIPPRTSRLSATRQNIVSAFSFSFTRIHLNILQIIIIAGYLAAAGYTMFKDLPLMRSSNRPAFIALAQFPVVFLFATKNSIVSFLLGPGNGYERLNYVHRWAGRGMFAGAAVHGIMHVYKANKFGAPVIGPPKPTTGVISLSLLGVLALTSLRPIRRLCYQVFLYLHILSFIGFFIAICYHAHHARPWIFPPLALYGLDQLLRLLRYRIKDATLIAVDDEMTLIRISDCDSGWEAGQHIRLRVFFAGRFFESHPLTIATAPTATSCLTNPGIVLGARACGDWTQALNNFTASERLRLAAQPRAPDAPPPLEIPAKVMVDGPYGGCSVDLGRHESVLLVAGGSGVTFTIGLLDDIVGRCAKLGRMGGERTRRVEFVWYIRSYDTIKWFSPILARIAKTASSSSLDLHMSIYITRPCVLNFSPSVPKCDIFTQKPAPRDLLQDFVGDSFNRNPTAAFDADNEKAQSPTHMQPHAGGGVAVCVSGPASLTASVANAVVRYGTVERMQTLGGISLHTESFSM
ncbi:hypothetical protein HGRIS_009034 [Hohenbuehelia grisea]|uniref:FAD-binding FR-type domain-containing protein n=1 Tax=Hohenbuehelia grisea TaxID=104357 RepID=A0ABR3J0B8_9AGAR